MSGRLSPETDRRIEALFHPNSKAKVADLLLHQCGNNLPFLEKLDEVELERYRFAALKLSDGNIEKLKEAIELAKTDWRDLLVAAGFATDLTAHKQWDPNKKIS